MNLTAGLDLAAVRDYSALAIVERIEVASDDVRTWNTTGETYMVPEQHYLVRHLVRWPQGTDPGDVVTDVQQLLAEPGVRQYVLLRFDATGMGVGVKSIIRERYLQGHFDRMPVGVSIHGGDKSTGTSAAKVDLISTVTRLQREHRLHIVRGLEHGMQLRRELLGYQVKVTASGRETFAAQTENVHDDMVIAVALAVWGRRPSQHAPARQLSSVEAADLLGAPNRR